MVELSAQDFKNIHALVEREFNFSGGVRDPSTLESVANRPEHGFYLRNPHPDIFAKAAAIFEGITCWQPFVDGNKRTALVVTRVYLAVNGYSFFVPLSAVRFTVQIARSNPETQEALDDRLRHIASWIRWHSGKTGSRTAYWQFNIHIYYPMSFITILMTHHLGRLVMWIMTRWLAFDIYPEYQANAGRMIDLLLQLDLDSLAGRISFGGVLHLMSKKRGSD
jgi:death-on-curing protein